MICAGCTHSVHDGFCSVIGCSCPRTSRLDAGQAVRGQNDAVVGGRDPRGPKAPEPPVQRVLPKATAQLATAMRTPAPDPTLAEFARQQHERTVLAGLRGKERANA